MAKYYARNTGVAMASADTEYTLGYDGAGNATNDIVVPVSASKITSVTVSIGADATAGDTTFYLIVTGDAVKDGTQKIAVGAVCTVGTSVGVGVIAAMPIPVDINVFGGRTLTLKAVASGSDLGNPTMGVGIEVV